MGKRTGIFIGIAIVIAVVVAVVVVLLIPKSDTNTSSEVQVIKVGSTLEQARAASRDAKVPCLEETTAAAEAVRSDDTYLDAEKTTSRFEFAAGFGIRDVPAGTRYDITINSYKDGVAVGSIFYDGDYGSYLYKTHKLEGKGNWQLEGLIPCRKL